ncbi:tyrosine-type recombinase/integrase [Streptomyces sp. NPDC002176]|uniref:tyrosine-type recombinase/integrase n=1 Tax=Streptomyces sp. NPDC002176 TaxID=3364634 RepID=UPI00384B6C24
MTTQITYPLTRESVESRLRLHAIPYLGMRPMGSFTPSHLRAWLRTLEDRGLSAGYRRGIFAHVSTVFTAAVEDRVIRVNPCSARSVQAPRLEPRKVRPWSAEQVKNVPAALPDRYQAMVTLAAGCGLRQGELFGMAVEDVDFLGGLLHVVRQVELLRLCRPVFAPPRVEGSGTFPGRSRWRSRWHVSSTATRPSGSRCPGRTSTGRPSRHR